MQRRKGIVSKRNHRELWKQLKVLIIYGKQNRYSKEELYDLMVNLELGQLVQDPLKELNRTVKDR